MLNKTTLLAILVLLCSTVFSLRIEAQVKLIKENCLTNNSFEDRFASYSLDGEKIVFESNRDGNWEIYLMNSDGTNPLRLTRNGSEDRRPSWHPNGKKILFESDRDGKNALYEICLKNKKVKKIFKAAKGDDLVFGSFSPNGKFIAVSLKESDDKSNIVLLNKKGKVIRQLTNHDKRSYYPKWSKSGDEIVYFSRKDTDNKDDEIYRLNLETDKEIRLTNWPKHNFCPSWSFDGKRIAYATSMEGSRPEIYIMDSDGTNQVRITENEDGDTLPNWSPKGNKLLITAYRRGNYEVCELELQID